MTHAVWLVLTAAMLAGQAAPPASGLDFQVYRTTVEPVFLKQRGAFNGPCFVCHTKVTSRLRLQPLSPGSSSWSEAQSRRNFEAVARVVTPGKPLQSRLLLHPLAADAGGSPVHPGGKAWQSQDDPEWQAVAAWVRAAPGAADAVSSTAATPALDFEAFTTRVQPILLDKRAGQARCYVCHSQGTQFRLQPLSAGRTSWNEEESRRNFEAIQRLVVPGDPLSSRLIMVPLAAEAGGDPFHPGGKRWISQSDPEWRMLADWVRTSSRTK